MPLLLVGLPGHGDEKPDTAPVVNNAAHTSLPGQDHLSHAREHQDIERAGANHDHSLHDHHRPPHSGEDSKSPAGHSHSHDSDASSFSCHADEMENYAAQLTSIFILEFGVIFHSLFIGLTLAVAGEEFKTLYIVLVFHQLFEGLGLGSRLAVVPFPKAKRWTPYLMALAYGLSTPIAIAIGLGVKNTYPPGGQTTLIVNGIFDSISAGILLYTGLVELMAHEFLFSAALRKGKKRRLFGAYGWMVLGAGKHKQPILFKDITNLPLALMSLLGKWA